jgi:hypothetical protein
MSFTPAEFLRLLRNSAGADEAEIYSPQLSYLTEKACELDNPDFRFVQRQPLAPAA